MSIIVLGDLKNKELDIFNAIDSNDADVLKYFQTNGGVNNNDVVNFTPYFEKYIMMRTLIYYLELKSLSELILNILVFYHLIQLLMFILMETYLILNLIKIQL